MKTTMKPLRTLFVLLATFLLACQSPVKYEPTGQLNLSVGTGAKSILPTGASIASYSAAGTGPSGATLATTSSTGSFTIGNLVPGPWTIHVDGLDASNTVIASGSTTVTIVTGTTATSSVDLVPPTGTGTLTLAASWPSGQTVDSVAGTLTPDGGTARAITLAISGSSATYTNASLASGSYLLVVNFRKGGVPVASTKTEAVVLYKGKTSSGTFDLTAADFQPLKTVTYDANTGSGTLVDPISPYPLGSTATVLANTFIKTGSFFAGWNSRADGTGTSYAAGASMTVTADTELFAQWRAVVLGPVGSLTGLATTVAGVAPGSTDGTGSAARFATPGGVVSDGTNLFVADTYNKTIRKVVIATGVVTTLAGTARLGGSTDGTGSTARFNSPHGMTTDGTNLFVTDGITTQYGQWLSLQGWSPPWLGPRGVMEVPMGQEVLLGSVLPRELQPTEPTYS